MLNSFLVMHAENLEILQRMYGSLTIFATQLFRVFMNIDIFLKIACTEPKV